MRPRGSSALQNSCSESRVFATGGPSSCEAVCGKGKVMKRRDGFTLLELLVVIGLIALLMVLLLPAIMKSKDNGKQMRTKANARALETAINAYKSRYHNWPAKKSDLEAGQDVTYGTDGHDNHFVIDKLVRPPDGGSAKDDPFLDLTDFIVDKNGNVLKEPVKGNQNTQYHITLDLDGDYSPSGGVSIN